MNDRPIYVRCASCKARAVDAGRPGFRVATLRLGQYRYQQVHRAACTDNGFTYADRVRQPVDGAVMQARRERDRLTFLRTRAILDGVDPDQLPALTREVQPW